MFLPLFFAAALGLSPANKLISPGLGSRVVVSTAAFLAGSSPGQYRVEAFTNAEGNVPGEVIENVIVGPRKLFLRDNTAKNVTLSIPTSSLTPGPLWICITENPKENKYSTSSGSQLTVLTRSCYQRILQSRKPIFLR